MLSELPVTLLGDLFGPHPNYVYCHLIVLCLLSPHSLSSLQGTLGVRFYPKFFFYLLLILKTIHIIKMMGTQEKNTWGRFKCPQLHSRRIPRLFCCPSGSSWSATAILPSCILQSCFPDAWMQKVSALILLLTCPASPHSLRPQSVACKFYSFYPDALPLLYSLFPLLSLSNTY